MAFLILPPPFILLSRLPILRFISASLFMNWKRVMLMHSLPACFFADFPYELNSKTERHYQVVFYLVFKLMGQFTQAEVRTAIGRADAVVKTADYIYVFEFKLEGTAEDALRQIDEKGYMLPYSVDGRKLIKVGVSFDAEKRNLGKWIIKE